MGQPPRNIPHLTQLQKDENQFAVDFPYFDVKRGFMVCAKHIRAQAHQDANQPMIGPQPAPSSSALFTIPSSSAGNPSMPRPILPRLTEKKRFAAPVSNGTRSGDRTHDVLLYPVATMSLGRYILISDSDWVNHVLRQPCLHCDNVASTNPISDFVQNGHVYSFDIQCTACRRISKICSNVQKISVGTDITHGKHASSFALINIMAVMSTVMGQFSSHALYEKSHMLLDKGLASSSFHRILGLICTAITQLTDEGLCKYWNEIVSNGESWVATIDGAWSTRGWCAHQFVLIVLNHLSPRGMRHMACISKSKGREHAGVVVHTGTHNGTSQAFENVCEREFFTKVVNTPGNNFVLLFFF